MATSSSDIIIHKFLNGGGDGNVGLSVVFELLKDQITNLGIEGLKKSVKDLEDNVNTHKVQIDDLQSTIDNLSKNYRNLIQPTFITYEELKELVDSSKLNTLSTYILTNYAPVLSEKYKNLAVAKENSEFALILLANTSSTFFPQCLAAQISIKDNNKSIDTIYNRNILYDFKNDEAKYDWIDGIKGKGVIYKMIDEYNNACPYDFYNIAFKFDNKDYYTFSTIDADGIYFYNEKIYNCHIEPIYINHIMSLPRNIITIEDQILDYNIHDIYINGIDNKINMSYDNENRAYACNNIKICSNGAHLVDHGENITIGSGCTFREGTQISGSNIKIGDGCTNMGNIIGENITIGNGCDAGQIGTPYRSSMNITIGNGCREFMIGRGDIQADNITLGNNCQASCLIGDSIRLEDGVFLDYFADFAGAEKVFFPLYNVSFKSGNGKVVIKLQCTDTVSEKVLISNYIFYLGSRYDSDTGDKADNNVDQYIFNIDEYWNNGDNSYLKMVYPCNTSGWITEIKGKS